jgi:hypothetical protein
MGLFSKKHKPVSRRRSAEQKERESLAKRRVYANEKLIEEADKDPQLRRKIIAENAGFTLPEEDPVYQQKRELENMLNTEAINTLKANPEMLQQMARKRISKITGVPLEDGEDNGMELPFEGDGDPSEESLIDRYHRLEEEFGGRRSNFVLEFANTEMGKAIGAGLANLIPLLIAKGGNGNSHSEQPVVQEQKVKIYVVDGKELTEQQYQQLKASQSQPALPEAKPEVPAVQPEQPIPVTDNIPKLPVEPELPIQLDSLPLDLIGEILDDTPEAFLIRLEEESDNKDLIKIRAILTNNSYELILQVLQPFRNHSKVGLYVQKLETPEAKEWISTVTMLLKGNTVPTE